jgi:hypothetical protein
MISLNENKTYQNVEQNARLNRGMCYLEHNLTPEGDKEYHIKQIYCLKPCT